MSDYIRFYCKTKYCSWSGNSDELVCTDADPGNFTHCPDCEGTDFDEEDEEDE